jgi:hypothetical protein
MTVTASIRRLAVLAGVGLGGLLAPAAHAGLLAARTIDANTGHDAIEVGSAIGNRRAWAAFVQQTGGVDRLYVDYAHNGKWARPVLADRGNAVDATGGAGLAGSIRGAAVAVFTESVNGKHVLFGRRLNNGVAGPVKQISANGEDVQFEPLIFHFLRGLKLAMDSAGAAAVCYHDAAAAKDIIATLAPGSSTWVEHVAGNVCSDMGMDDRGNVLSVGIAGNQFDATRVVGGQVKTDTISNNVMDEPSVGISPTGLAIALARDTNFHVVGFRKRDIAKDTPWESLGRIDSDTVFDNGDSPEEPRVTLDRNNNGLIIWHSNSMNDPKTAFAAVSAGQPMTATFLSKEGTDSFPYAATIAPGMPAAAFELPGTNSAVLPFHHGTPNPPLTAAPGMAPTILGSAAGFVGDGAGNMLMLISQGQNPQHTVAVFGDFAPPTLRPSLSTHRPHAKKVVTLRSGATDTFANVEGNKVRWTLPTGVKPLAGTRGLKIRVRFARPGRYTIKLTATDAAGNSASAKLKVKVSK